MVIEQKLCLKETQPTHLLKCSRTGKRKVQNRYWRRRDCYSWNRVLTNRIRQTSKGLAIIIWSWPRKNSSVKGLSKEIWRSQIPKKLCKKFRSWKTSQSRCQDDQHIKHKHGNDAIISRKTPKSFSCTLGHVWPSEKRNRTRKIEIVCAGNQIFRFSFIIFVFSQPPLTEVDLFERWNLSYQNS